MAEQKRLWEKDWTKGTAMQATAVKRKRAGAPQLYTLQVFLTDGPVTKAFTGKEISRTIQMRGDQTLQAMQLERIELGGTVHVITPYDEGVLHHRQMLEHVPVVCNTQLYLDLFQHPTRGKEAAEFLRKERMKI